MVNFLNGLAPSLTLDLTVGNRTFTDDLITQHVLTDYSIKDVLTWCFDKEVSSDPFVVGKRSYRDCCHYRSDHGYENGFPFEDCPANPDSDRSRVHGIAGLGKWKSTRVHDKWIIPLSYDNSVANRNNLLNTIRLHSAYMGAQTCVRPIDLVGKYGHNVEYWMQIQDNGSGCNAAVGASIAGYNFPVNLAPGCDWGCVGSEVRQ